MQKTLKFVLILTMVYILALTTACSQAAVGQEKVTAPEAETTAATEPESVSAETEEAPEAETTEAAEPESSPAVTEETPETEATEATEPESVPSETQTASAAEEPQETEAVTAEPAPSEPAGPAVTSDVKEETAAPESAAKEDPVEEQEPNEPADIEIIEDGKVAMSGSEPEPPSYPEVEAPGTREAREGNGVIDYSNTEDGYVMVKYSASTSNRLKALVKGPSTQYQYDLQPNEWAALPLSEGDGTYQIGIYENVRGTSYAQIIAKSISVTLDDEFAPFLRSNQYVNFEAAPETVLKASELCEDIDDTLEKVGAVYDFVVGELTYDYDFADRVKGGSISSYVPDLDSVLENEKGICLDYAGLMTGMLRSQCVPCKLVVGYTGTNYHAWISVWTEEDGWIENTIYFDGENWQRMDPTFASTGKKSEKTMKYIGDGKNYVAKFFY